MARRNTTKSGPRYRTRSDNATDRAHRGSGLDRFMDIITGESLRRVLARANAHLQTIIDRQELARRLK